MPIKIVRQNQRAYHNHGSAFNGMGAFFGTTPWTAVYRRWTAQLANLVPDEK